MTLAISDLHSLKKYLWYSQQASASAVWNASMKLSRVPLVGRPLRWRRWSARHWRGTGCLTRPQSLQIQRLKCSVFHTQCLARLQQSHIEAKKGFVERQQGKYKKTNKAVNVLTILNTLPLWNFEPDCLDFWIGLFVHIYWGKLWREKRLLLQEAQVGCRKCGRNNTSLDSSLTNKCDHLVRISLWHLSNIYVWLRWIHYSILTQMLQDNLIFYHVHACGFFCHTSSTTDDHVHLSCRRTGHQFVSDWNISTTVGWIVMYICKKYMYKHSQSPDFSPTALQIDLYFTHPVK